MITLGTGVRVLALTVGLMAPALGSVAMAADPSATPTPGPWERDLKYLDTGVRIFHPGPFTIHPESEWTAKLAQLRESLPTASPDEQVVQLASLVGLLDTHSGFTAPFHAYDMMAYPFADGWFVVVASDPTLVGSRLISINGMPVADVEAAMRPLVPADNESGKLDGLQYPMSSVEFLHGLGIVDDPAKPDYVFQGADGSTRHVDLGSTDEPSWEQKLGIIGDLMGPAPEAVARRGEPIWTRVDLPTKAFLISLNDYPESGIPEVVAAMDAALDDGSADHVVLDMRYLRGGNGSLAFPLLDALSGDPRVNRPGGLTVMTGRENVSAGTVVAATLDQRTPALFVGEETPARADNFLCDCHDIVLPNSGFTVTVPTFTFHTGDPRDSVPPDVPMALTSSDFFAGRDPVLDAVLGGDLPSSAP